MAQKMFLDRTSVFWTEICQIKKRHVISASKCLKAKMKTYSSPRDKSLYIPLVVTKVP